jgi:hypothetical protein
MSSFFSGGLKGMLEEQVFPWFRDRLSLDVHVRDATLQMLTGAINVRGLRMARLDAEGPPLIEPLLECDEMTVQAGLRDLMAGRGISLSDLRMNRIVINLDRLDIDRLRAAFRLDQWRDVTQKAGRRIPAFAAHANLDHGVADLRFGFGSGGKEWLALPGRLRMEGLKTGNGGSGRLMLEAGDDASGRIGLNIAAQNAAAGDWDIDLRIDQLDLSNALRSGSELIERESVVLDLAMAASLRGGEWGVGDRVTLRVLRGGEAHREEILLRDAGQEGALPKIFQRITGALGLAL